MDQASPEALEHIDALERLGMKVWQIGAAQLRMMYHTLRGEEERARSLRSQVEELLLQVGSAWQMEVWVPPCLAYAYSQTRDVIGMKQTLEHVTRLEAAGFPFARVSPWLKSEYYRERGELDLALENNLLAFATQPEEDMVWYPIMAARADILLASGDFSGAQAVAQECLALSRQPGRRRLGLIARSVRTLALAEAREGKVETAIERLRIRDRRDGADEKSGDHRRPARGIRPGCAARQERSALPRALPRNRALVPAHAQSGPDCAFGKADRTR